MTIDDFWDLMERSRKATDTPEERAAWLVDRLAEGSLDDLVAFNDHAHGLSLRAYTWNLWGATSVMGDGVHSDVGFDRFRAWLIGQGREVYERVVGDPDSLADVAEVRELAARPRVNRPPVPAWEEMTGLAGDAYEQRTGEDWAGSVVDTDFLPVYPPGDDGWDLDEDHAETARRLPRLSALFDWTI